MKRLVEKNYDDLEVVLSCKDLRKEFKIGESVEAIIKGINLSFKRGEFVSIMGPSGSGKSTLLYLLSGIEEATSGEVKLLGKEIKEYSASEISLVRSRDISFVFQNYNLIPNFSVYENVITPLCLGKLPIVEKEIDDILDLLGILKHKNREVVQLSGGEQQRVAIARALANKPEIIFSDEATGNLDSKGRTVVMEMFQKINELTDITIIQVTHDPTCAEYSDRLIRIEDGLVSSDTMLTKKKGK